ncbi:MAG: NAD+ synthase [Alphaproteobacteria bacterium]
MINPIKITMAQLNPTLGDIKGNAKKILETWKNHDEQSDLILFPELFLCGYPPEDLTNNTGFIDALKNKIDDLIKQSKALNAAALIPTIWREGEHIYNAALLIQNGEIKHTLKKHHLPNYSVFDEARNFKSAPLPNPIEINGTKLGIMICEDMWHTDLPIHLKKKGAQLLISINASPYYTNKHNRRISIAKSCVKSTGLDLIYLNLIGGQDELVFDGRSFIMDKNENIIFDGASFKQEITQIKISDGKIDITDTKSSDQNTFENDTYNALVTGTRDYVRKNGFSKVIIGLSGGIDSAITAAIAVDALGADNVHCVMMPSQFTSTNSLDDAQECAQMLGVKYDTIAMRYALEAFESLLPTLKGLAHENTQSRIRGTILMAMSNASGAMLLTTGNKSEMAVGYCTIYGDMNGGYNPIKDVYKTHVYELAKWRNSVSPIMPESIITKAPSAELRPDQTDQDNLPPYDLLDDILYALIEHDDQPCPPDIITRISAHPETIEKVAKLLKNSEYKRYQAAPGVRISYKAFGRDRRYPMTNHFVNKIEKSS